MFRTLRHSTARHDRAIPPTGAAGPAPTLNSFTINGDPALAKASPNANMTLAWSVSGATQVQLTTGSDYSWSNWSAVGSATVTAAASRNFFLRAKNGGNAWQTYAIVHSVINPTASAPNVTGLGRYDSFGRANSSTSLGTPSDGGSAWSATTGTWGITSDQGYNPTGNAAAIAVLATGQSDIQLRVTISNYGNQAGVAFRVQDASNYWVFKAHLGGGQNVSLYKVAAGVETHVGDTGPAPSFFTKLELIVTCTGSTITVNCESFNLSSEGAPFTTTDSYLSTQQSHGLYANSDSSVTFAGFSCAFPSKMLDQNFGILDFTANVTTQSTKTGSWFDPTVWSGGSVPGSSDVAWVMNGHVVTVDQLSNVPVNGVGVRAGGSLVFATNAKVRLTACHVVVYDTDGVNGQGYLEIGNTSNPVNPTRVIDQTACLALASAPISALDSQGWGPGLYVYGKIRTYGQSQTQFVRCAAAPQAGDTSITFQSAVAGWTQGDRLLMADSWQYRTGETASRTEALTLESVSADGKTITFRSSMSNSNALQYTHPGSNTPNNTATSEYLPHVANMSRWASIRTLDPTDTNRPHVWVSNRADANLQYTTIHSTGRATPNVGKAIQFNRCWGPALGSPQPEVKYTTASGTWTASSNTWTVTDAGASVLEVGDFVSIGSGYTAQITLISNIGNIYTFTVSSTAVGGTKPANGTYTVTCGYQFSITGCSVMDPFPGTGLVTAGAQWGISVIESSWGHVNNNVVVSWGGGGIVCHHANELYNTIENNFVSLIRGSGNNTDMNGNIQGDASGAFNGSRQGEGIGLWGRNHTQRWRNNVASDVSSGGGGYYTYGIAGTPLQGGGGLLAPLPAPAYPGANLYSGAPADSITYDPGGNPILENVGNEVYGGGNGSTYWYVNFDRNFSYGPTPTRGLGTGGTVKNYAVWNPVEAGLGIFNYPMSGVTVDGAVMRGWNSVLQNSGGTRADTGILTTDYSASNFTVKNCDIQGFNSGIGGFVNYYVQNYVQNTHFCNLANLDLGSQSGSIGVVVYLQNDPSFWGRNFYFQNCTYDVYPGNPLETVVLLTIPTAGTITEPTVINVTAHQGVTGDDFGVYFLAQSPNAILPRTVATGSPLSACPEPGLTNARSHDRFNPNGTLKNMSAALAMQLPGICLLGNLLPGGTTSRADVVGQSVGTVAVIRKPIVVTPNVRYSPKVSFKRQLKFRSKFGV